MSTTYKNIVATVLGLALMFALAFTVAKPAQAATLSQSQVDAIINLLVSFGADQATINNVRAALTGQPANNTGSGNANNQGSSSCVPMVFTMNHKVGDRGGEVMKIQKFLNANGFTVAVSGPGSAGNETSYFGPATKAAVAKFQNAYASEILAPVGLSYGTGYWGTSTRAKANAMEQARCASQNQNNNNNDDDDNNNNNDDNNNNNNADELTVSAAAQPANSLAPAGAKNVPFTRFTLTAGSSSVVVDEVVVELTGLAQTSNFSNVTILDEDGNEVTNRKTIGSDRMAKFTKNFTVPANSSKTYTVVANMAASVSTGEVASIAVKSIKADKDVNGSLPIVGASHTMNNSLTIGSLEVDGTSTPITTVNVGDQNEKIAEFDFSASNEDVKITKVVFADATGNTVDFEEAFADVTAEFMGKTYDVMVTDNDEMVVDLGSGVTLEDGDNETMTVRANIVSRGGSAATTNFRVMVDDDKTMAMGESYGFGADITDANSDNASGVDITGDGVTIERDSSFPSNNTATPGEKGVMLAKMKITNATGEDVTVADFDFDVILANGSTTASDNNLTNFALYKGATRVYDYGTVAMPATSGTVTVNMTDVVIEPGVDVVYTIMADMDKDVPNNATYDVHVNQAANAEDEAGDNVGVDISDFDQTTEAQQTTVTTGDFTAKQTTDDINEDRAVLDGSSNVVLGQYEFKADDAEIEVDGFDVVFNADPSSLVSGDIDLYVDGNKVASESAAATVSFTNLNIKVEKDSDVTVEIKTDVQSGVTGSIQITDLNNFAYESMPNSETLTGVTTMTKPTVQIVQSLPVVTEVNAGTITVSSSYVSDKNVLEFSVKAEGDDVEVEKIDIAAANGATGMSLKNVELKVYSDAAHNNEVITVTSTAAWNDNGNNEFVVNEVISAGDTYYFVLEGDIASSSGDYMTLTVVREDAANNAVQVDLAAIVAGGDDDELGTELVLSDDIKSTINTVF